MGSLRGKRVVVTRAAHQAEELASLLRDRGAEVILLPIIAIAEPADSAPLQKAAARCDTFDWIIFSSANAVTSFVAELQVSPAQCRARIAAIGTATSELAEKHGFVISLVPEEFVAESLVTALANEKLEGQRILIPSAAATREVLPNQLRKLGATVDVVEAYRNIIPEDAVQRANTVFREPFPDWLTFTSSSAADNLLNLLDNGTLATVKIATIGPVTSSTVRKHGFVVAAEANPHTVAGLVAAMCGDERL